MPSVVSRPVGFQTMFSFKRGFIQIVCCSKFCFTLTGLNSISRYSRMSDRCKRWKVVSSGVVGRFWLAILPNLTSSRSREKWGSWDMRPSMICRDWKKNQEQNQQKVQEITQTSNCEMQQNQLYGSTKVARLKSLDTFQARMKSFNILVRNYVFWKKLEGDVSHNYQQLSIARYQVSFSWVITKSV